MERLQKKYAAASRTLAAQSRMLDHLRETVQQREADHAASQVRPEIICHKLLGAQNP